MKITALVENTSQSEIVGSEHGLSLHIALDDFNILLDTGLGELFYHNANALGIDISQVDYLIISHAHSDHGGGLATFLEHNPTAGVLVRPSAFDKYYAQKQDETEEIGLDQSLANHEQMIVVEQDIVFLPGIRLFSGIDLITDKPSTNHGLMMARGDDIVPDEFRHEQYLIIETANQTVLFSGCSHNGIVNIVSAAKQRLGRYPDIVIGGFHLSNPYWETNETDSAISKIGEFFRQTGARYYTCHCTGQTAYKQLKDQLGPAIEYLAGGQVLNID